MKKIYFALLVSASWLSLGFPQADANEAEFVTDPVVLRPGESAPPPASTPMRTASADRPDLGGGFIEFLFGDRPGPGYQPQGQVYQRQPSYQPQPAYQQQPAYQVQPMTMPQQSMGQPLISEPAHAAFDPKYEKQMVDYDGKEAAGTIIVDTPNKFLYLVEGHGKALRYGIGVGRPGFAWSGVKTISAKKEWPDWTPPSEMLARRPDLPRHMEGGPQNPLGARAMYLGSTLYRIHGSNEPWTIGTNVSSGCIRMRNEDVIDLYGRVNVGTRVVVI
jgi:lipoprotein-anchoring transpeptidase ErfK/SrfK